MSKERSVSNKSGSRHESAQNGQLDFEDIEKDLENEDMLAMT